MEAYPINKMKQGGVNGLFSDASETESYIVD